MLRRGVCTVRLVPRSIAKGWRWTERLAWAGGVAAVGLWSVLSVSGAMGARRELQRFAESQEAAAPAFSTPDQRLWSTARVKAWLGTLATPAPLPVAVLRIPAIDLEVAVLEGTDEWTLNRAVGLIDGTARPGDAGNMGIAGHRDGFFRGLKDVHVGVTAGAGVGSSTETSSGSTIHVRSTRW